MKSTKEIFETIINVDRSQGVEELYNLQYNKMYAMSFSITKNYELSENIVHDVIYQLLIIDESLFPSNNENAWLYSVVKNSTLRVVKRENIYDDSSFLDEICVDDKSINDFVDLDEFNDMLKDLNEDQKRVVSLKVLGGYTHKEIGEILGKPTSTIQWIYNKSIKSLRALLAGFIPCMVILGLGLLLDITFYEIYENMDGGHWTEKIWRNRQIIIGFMVGICASITVITSLFITFFKKFSKTPTKNGRSII